MTDAKRGSATLGLVADIGGTNVRFALVDARGRLRAVRTFAVADFPGPAAAARAYLTAVDARPHLAAFAVASPVLGDRVTLTNHPWSFSRRALQRTLGISALAIVNDFQAIALAVPGLSARALRKVGGGAMVRVAPKAVIGPGTGLGVAALVPCHGGWHSLATEGGHVTMAAFDKTEAEVLQVLGRDLGHVSAEKVLSGPGLQNLHRALSRIAGLAETPTPDPATIAERALDRSCLVCVEALGMFAAMLGTVASNLALTLGARGGVYIAGGIVPRLGAWFTRSPFRTRFESKGRFGAYLKAIPTYVVRAPEPALLGLAGLLRAMRSAK
jgi:glucokinase